MPEPRGGRIFPLAKPTSPLVPAYKRYKRVGRNERRHETMPAYSASPPRCSGRMRDDRTIRTHHVPGSITTRLLEGGTAPRRYRSVPEPRGGHIFPLAKPNLPLVPAYKRVGRNERRHETMPAHSPSPPRCSGRMRGDRTIRTHRLTGFHHDEAARSQNRSMPEPRGGRIFPLAKRTSPLVPAY